jgi:predicted nucleotide-binding protein
MAARKTPPHKPERPNLPLGEKAVGIAALQRRIDEVDAFDPQTVQKRFGDPVVRTIETAIDETLSDIFGHNTVEYRRYVSATRFDDGPIMMSYEHGGGTIDGAAAARHFVTEGKVKVLALLRQAKRRLEEEIADAQRASISPQESVPAQKLSPKVFIVHGHDEGMREAVARFIEAIGLKAIILHEQANMGRTIIEKVEANVDVGFAVVLLSPDDDGCAKGETLVSRARQNVLMELGFFIGLLDRRRVCALKRGGIELPSDFGGVVYEEYDDSGGWKQKLARELEAVGYAIDWNKVMRS